MPLWSLRAPPRVPDLWRSRGHCLFKAQEGACRDVERRRALTVRVLLCLMNGRCRLRSFDIVEAQDTSAPKWLYGADGAHSEDGSLAEAPRTGSWGFYARRGSCVLSRLMSAPWWLRLTRRGERGWHLSHPHFSTGEWSESCVKAPNSKVPQGTAPPAHDVHYHQRSQQTGHPAAHRSGSAPLWHLEQWILFGNLTLTLSRFPRAHAAAGQQNKRLQAQTNLLEPARVSEVTL